MADYGRRESARPSAIWNWRTLDLRLVLERWSRAVPDERIHVLPLDKTRPRDDIWHRFAGVVGLPGDAYDTASAFANQSMGVVEAELLRRVNQHLGDFNRSFDKGVYIRSFLADERLVPRGGEPFWPLPDQIADCRRRADDVLALLDARSFDVVGDASALQVPEEIPERRTPDSVTDAEVADAGAELVAVLLGDIRELRRKPGAQEGPTGRLSQLLRRVPWRR